jgi:hypothetical protein
MKLIIQFLIQLSFYSISDAMHVSLFNELQILVLVEGHFHRIDFK